MAITQEGDLAALATVVLAGGRMIGVAPLYLSIVAPMGIG